MTVLPVLHQGRTPTRNQPVMCVCERECVCVHNIIMCVCACMRAYVCVCVCVYFLLDVAQQPKLQTRITRRRMGGGDDGCGNGVLG